MKLAQNTHMVDFVTDWGPRYVGADKPSRGVDRTFTTMHTRRAAVAGTEGKLQQYIESWSLANML